MPEQQGGFARAAKDCASGTVGGIVQVFAGQPFDTVKVRLQTQPIPKPGEQPRYTSMIDCVRKTYKAEGPFAFYKGTTTPLVGIGACVSIQFVVLEFMKRVFNEKNGYTGFLSNSQLYFAGAAAGIANSIVSGPVEHIRTRLQVQVTPTQTSSTPSTKTYSGPIDFIKKVYASHGIRGLYKGQGITMVREFQGYGAYFLAYEYLMQQTMKREHKSRDELASWKPCLFGALAGYAMWTSVYPVDVLKSKLQTDGFTPETRKYNGVIDCARKIHRTEGVKGFFRGFDKKDDTRIAYSFSRNEEMGQEIAIVSEHDDNKAHTVASIPIDCREEVFVNQSSCTSVTTQSCYFVKIEPFLQTDAYNSRLSMVTQSKQKHGKNSRMRSFAADSELWKLEPDDGRQKNEKDMAQMVRGLRSIRIARE
ncbi:11086_t:CDS:2 [Paraglomus brasilianum]|uniref:11086_t:CDS:1 n=1 Tax=Paraglomus brasilianum TaxID=144538 RepID=A0A9N9GH06_9GLOM|nr:11086_t:CDS:2 [Paraglomus brasilianum]